MEPTIKCPFCAEEILAEAKKCKHCGEIVDNSLKKEDSPNINITQNSGVEKQIAYESQKKNGFVAAILNFLLPGVGYFYCGNVVLGLLVLFLAIAALLTGGLGFIVLTPIVIIDGFLAASRANKKLGKKLVAA